MNSYEVDLDIYSERNDIGWDESFWDDPDCEEGETE